MASIDLSTALELNTHLLIKCLSLIKLWLSKRSFYVKINGNNSFVVDLIGGTIQSSILGLLLYAIYTSLLFNLIRVSSFADDSFVIPWNKCLEGLNLGFKKDSEVINKWLKDSGLKKN
jgi:hypothetical protein